MADQKKSIPDRRPSLSAEERQRLIRKFCLLASRDDSGMTLEERQETLRHAINLLMVGRIRQGQADRNQHPEHQTKQ